MVQGIPGSHGYEMPGTESANQRMRELRERSVRSSCAPRRSDAEGSIHLGLPSGIVVDRLEAHAEGYPRITTA